MPRPGEVGVASLPLDWPVTDRPSIGVSHGDRFGLGRRAQVPRMAIAVFSMEHSTTTPDSRTGDSSLVVSRRLHEFEGCE